MREIKFRAWSKESKYMKYDIQSTEPNYGEWDCFAYYLKNDNYILMQYTGLLDKNGKEIYEGDILILYDKNDPFKNGGVVCDDFVIRNFIEDSYTITAYTKQGKEIIGNIYENPELLEAK